MTGLGKLWRGWGSLAVAGAFVGVTLLSGCAEHARYRVYDPDYHDYHRWDRGEQGYYVRWEDETHRRHEDFRRRDQREQEEYWEWRHRHDRDRDRDDHPHR